MTSIIGELHLLFAMTEDATYQPIHMKYIDRSSNTNKVLYQLHVS